MLLKNILKKYLGFQRFFDSAGLKLSRIKIAIIITIIFNVILCLFSNYNNISNYSKDFSKFENLISFFAKLVYKI